MTISSSSRKAGPFIGNGSASVFAFSFRVFAASDLEVVRIAVSTGVETTLTINSGYTVSLNADQNSNPGGSITLVGGALASGQNLIITSNIANLQPTDLTNQGGFYPEVITDALDRATIQIQQLDEHVGRTLAYPITDPVVGTELPAIAQRKGMVLAFDETTGAPIVGPNIAAVGTAVSNAANINTVANSIGSVNITAANVASVNNFSSVYLGARSTDPSTRTNGSALQSGDMYYNTAQNRMKAWGGSAWYTTETLGATAASLVTFAPLGPITAGNVQDALAGIARENMVSAWESIKMRMRLGRVDFIGIGDSNQLHQGNGWDHGIQYALSLLFPMYATGLVSINENNSNGGGIGYTYNYNAAAPLIGVNTGAPAFFDNYLTPGITLHQYGYLDTGTFAAGNNSGLILGSNCVLDNTAALNFNFYYGTFATGSGGSINASVRENVSPYSTIATSGALTTTTGTDGIAIGTVSIAADSGRAGKPLNFKWAGGGDIVAPFFGTYVRASNPSRTTGFSYHTLIGEGGASLRTMASILTTMTDTTLSHFLSETRRLQGSIKTVVIVVNSGLNDRNETGTSLGPNPTADGDSPEAFVDNFTAIWNRIRTIWAANGWDLSELFFLTYVSHPVSDPDNSELVSYRSAIFNYMAPLENTQIISLTDLTTSAEMTANSWYITISDKNHLSQTGYEVLSQRIINKLQ